MLTKLIKTKPFHQTSNIKSAVMVHNHEMTDKSKRTQVQSQTLVPNQAQCLQLTLVYIIKKIYIWQSTNQVVNRIYKTAPVYIYKKYTTTNINNKKTSELTELRIFKQSIPFSSGIQHLMPIIQIWQEWSTDISSN